MYACRRLSSLRLFCSIKNLTDSEVYAFIYDIIYNDCCSLYKIVLNPMLWVVNYLNTINFILR